MSKYREDAVSRHDTLLRWRMSSVSRATPLGLAESLSVAGLPYEQIPEAMWAMVTAFRKLRHDQRERVCASLIKRLTCKEKLALVKGKQ